MSKTGEQMRVGLVACVKTKRPVASAAKDLYDSPLFRGQRRAVEASCDRWYILTARHGLVDPEQVLEPYEETLVGAGGRVKRAWAQRVLHQLDDQLGDLDGVRFEVHAGKDYYAHGLLAGLEERGGAVDLPVEGLPLGERLAWYARAEPATGKQPGRKRTGRTRHAGSRATGAAAPPRGKYRPLHELLVAIDDERWDATFAEIEDVLGFVLPATARAHPAWWSNAPNSHSQARAWVEAGWRTENVRLTAECVTFVRTERR